MKRKKCPYLICLPRFLPFFPQVRRHKVSFPSFGCFFWWEGGSCNRTLFNFLGEGYFVFQRPSFELVFRLMVCSSCWRFQSRNFWPQTVALYEWESRPDQSLLSTTWSRTSDPYQRAGSSHSRMQQTWVASLSPEWNTLSSVEQHDLSKNVCS